MSLKQQRSISLIVLSVLFLFIPDSASAAVLFWQSSPNFSLLPSSSQQESNSTTTQTAPQPNFDISSQNLATPNLTLQQQTTYSRQTGQVTERNGRAVNLNQPEPPVELSDFQRLVASSVGKVLPI